MKLLQTCSELVLVLSGLRNPDCTSTMEKRVFRGYSDYVIRKHHVTRPIFEVSGLQNPKKSVTPFFTL